MTLMKNIRVLKIKNRLATIRTDVLVAFIIATAIILVTELWLYKYPAFNEQFYKTGQIFIKLSYSYVSAFIFFFLVVHLPKENKKINTYRIISVKIGEMGRFLVNILFQMEQATGDTLQGMDFDKITLTKTLVKIKSHTPVSSLTPMNVVFNDWYDFVQHNGEEIKRLTTEIFLFNETLDNEVLELVGQIDRIVSWGFTRTQGKPGNEDLVLYAEPLTQLNKVFRSTNQKFHTKYGRYHGEVTHEMEKRGEYRPL